MKKYLITFVIWLFLSANSLAADNTKIKPGSGQLKLSEETVKEFHIYLTEKLNQEIFKEKKLFGISMQLPNSKPRYANYFHVMPEINNKGYIFVWWNDNNISAVEGPSFGCENGRCKQFAKKNKIVWKVAKKKISRKVTLNELKVILKDLGFYDD